MPAIPAIVAIAESVAVVGGLVEGGIALSQAGGNKPQSATLPSETAAANTAQAAQTQSRQAALAAGGSTNVTGGSGIILGSDISSVTLVGSS